MKKKLLLVLPLLALFSCGQTQEFEKGVVTNTQTQTNVKKLYNRSLDNTEDLEDLSDLDVIDEDLEEPSEGEIEEPPVEEEPTTLISSYHVDYVIDYAFSASLDGHKIYENYEKQTYSLTYVEMEEEVFLKMNLAHEYKEDRFAGKQNIEVIYQKVEDEKYRLFVTQEIENGFFGNSHKMVEKTSHRINPKHIYHEYGDYFISMAENAMLDPSSRLENDSLLETLLTSDEVEIINVDENSVKIKFNYNDTVTTMVFNTELETFTSIVFDKSNVFNHVLEENENNENPFTIDESRYMVSMDFTYNDSLPEKLTAEEMQEYYYKNKDYGHYNDRYYGEEKKDHHNGYHGGHDPYHGEKRDDFHY